MIEQYTDFDNFFEHWQRHAEQEEFGSIRVVLELSKTHRIIPRQEPNEASATETRNQRRTRLDPTTQM